MQVTHRKTRAGVAAALAFSLAGASLIFGLVGMAFGVFDPSNFGSLASRYIGFMTNEVLVAVPLFIFIYLKLEAREGWLTTVAVTFLSWLFFYMLFERMLNVPFPDPLLLSFFQQ